MVGSSGLEWAGCYLLALSCFVVSWALDAVGSVHSRILVLLWPLLSSRLAQACSHEFPASQEQPGVEPRAQAPPSYLLKSPWPKHVPRPSPGSRVEKQTVASVGSKNE